MTKTRSVTLYHVRVGHGERPRVVATEAVEQTKRYAFPSVHPGGIGTCCDKHNSKYSLTAREAAERYVAEREADVNDAADELDCAKRALDKAHTLLSETP